MRISIHGNDKGYAVLLSLLLVLSFSLIFLSFVPRVIALNRYAREYKTKIIQNIETSNGEIIKLYDLN
jgi:hypothetical protein